MLGVAAAYLRSRLRRAGLVTTGQHRARAPLESCWRSALTYVIVPADSSHKSSLRRWILYGMGAGQEFGPALDFAPLPPVIKRAATAAVGRFSG